MKRSLKAFALVLAALSLSSCSPAKSGGLDAAAIREKLAAIPLDQEVRLTNAEWQAILSPAQFEVMRHAGTEQPSVRGNALEHHAGRYVCAACGNPLYSAEAKFNSGTGWPSFWQPLRKEAVHASNTTSTVFGSEISCARCGSHLGHVFNDGPPPTGLRYCMNAIAMKFEEPPIPATP